MSLLKIGIAGLGNVGEEVAYQLIKGFRVQKNLFEFELVAVSAKSKNKSRKIKEVLCCRCILPPHIHDIANCVEDKERDTNG